MNLITHLLRKDIRRSRGLLIAWLLLLILHGVLVSSRVNPGDQLKQAVFAMISGAVPLFKALLLVVIVPFVVQDEPLVGTIAFWLTRPISRGTLLLAKTLYAMAVLVLPALLVEMIVLAANGFTPHDLALAAPEILLGQIKLIVIVAVIAALTPTFGKYAIVGASGLIAWWVAVLALQWARMYLHPDRIFEQAMNGSLEKSTSVAVGLMAILVCAAVVAHQYLSGRTFRSYIAGSAGVVAILAVQSLWRWDFLFLPVPRSNVPLFDVSAVVIALASDATARDVSEIRGQGPARKEIWASIESSGVPSMYSLRAKSIWPRLTRSNGSKLDVESTHNTQLSMRLNQDALVAALGGTPIANPDTWSAKGAQNTPLFVIDAATYGKDYDQPLNLSADIDFIGSKYLVTAEMPLAKGARSDQGSKHSVITEVLSQPDGVDVVLRERKPNLLFDRANGSNAFMQEFIEGYRHIYVLRNKKRNQAILQKHNNFSFPFDQMFGHSRLVNDAVQVSFGPESNSKGLTPELTPEWLADAELIRLDLTPVFEFSKQLMVEGFKMHGPFDLKGLKIDGNP